MFKRMIRRLGGSRASMTAIVVPALLALAACGGTSAAGRSHAAQLASSCPSNAKLAEFIADDASGSSRSPDVAATRRAVIKDEVTRVALCGGVVRVVGFSISSVASVVLLDIELDAQGGTLQAKERHVDDAVNPAMKDFDAKVAALTALPANGTDVLGQFQLAKEFFDQHATAAHRGLFLTDGISTEGQVNLNVPDLSDAVAVDLASRITLPDLTGGSFVIAGIGRTSGDPAPSTYVAALKAFYTKTCERLLANPCQVLTDISTS